MSGFDKAFIITPAAIAEILKAVDATPGMIAETLLALGDPCYRRGANAILRTGAGRTPFDDHWCVAQARELFEQGEAKSLNAAFHLVAKAQAPYAKRRALVERWRRKDKALHGR